MVLARTEEEDAYWRAELAAATAADVPIAQDESCRFYAYTDSLLCAFSVVSMRDGWSGSFRLEYRISGCKLILMVACCGEPPSEVRISPQTFDVLAANWHGRMDAA